VRTISRKEEIFDVYPGRAKPNNETTMRRDFKTPDAGTAGAPAYATGSEFCRIFDEDMKSLYLLSFLLTADHEKAEECFVSGIQNCVGENRVFRDWARSWARRTIIQNAIRMIAPRRRHASDASPMLRKTGEKAETSSAIESFSTAITQFAAFERFVFVMSVLERYSDQDCSMLLGCSRQDVIAGRALAVRQLAETSAACLASGETPQALPVD